MSEIKRFDETSIVRLSVFKGTNVSLYVTLTDQLACRRLNLGSAHAWFTVKWRITDLDEQAIIQKTNSSGLTLVDVEQGLIRIDIIPSDTLNLPNFYYEYPFDLQVQDMNSNVLEVIVGTFAVNPKVVKNTGQQIIIVIPPPP